ncbi:CpsB/CapC family capsule biosynthesis tyrosine phosphatase [Carboxydochorda subterranea]|uniref:protein-tyrosine-phosphatase n=1 Tax=Carboxydichorda subterranea TaxID=3109565 RepID=A0ABZ1BWV1_9FIRM|nr:CpsB/CapC family capsule biosynthesis tyrosine phosphatase [Limnochorda sp. L945t]WRP16955.1 CpsB/CapC family capsule biosynthesis tyrosine phosphatase [Limnochorda sp. L945t]
MSARQEAPGRGLRDLLPSTSGFVDIHHHLLPGLDDGPGSWEESLAMARAAAAAGVGLVVATPHVRPGAGDCPERKTVVQRVEELQERLWQAGIPLTVLPGAEVYPVAGLGEWLSSQGTGVPGLGAEGPVPYVLVDLPAGRLPPLFDRLLYEVGLGGFVPVVAHPERNHELAARRERLVALAAQGALFQVTAGSLLGAFGQRARETGWWCIEQGMAAAVATDAHDVRARSPAAMEEAYREVVRVSGERLAQYLFVSAPLAIARGEPLPAAPGTIGIAGRRRSQQSVRRPQAGLARVVLAWLARLAGSAG